MSQKNRSWEYADKVLLVAMLRAGLSYGKIAKDFGVSRSAIAGIVYRIRRKARARQ